MHFQYIRFIHDPQAPGKGANVHGAYRVGDLATGMQTSWMHAMLEKGQWIVLIDKRGNQRLVPLSNVVDAEEESAETKAYRVAEAEKMKAAAKGEAA